MIYQKVNLQNDKEITNDTPPNMITVSVDEKPGVQVISTVAPDSPPVAGRHKTVGRDYDYKLMGTLSILATLDLHSGKIIAQVHDRHCSREFIELLKELDSSYPKKSIVRIVLDNHSAHISKETMKYLSSRPNRFVYVHTPKYGSWVNRIKMAFSKMARTFYAKSEFQAKMNSKNVSLKELISSIRL